MSAGQEQVCSTEGCARTAAFTTRTKPAWCVECIADKYRAGGLEPLEPWRDHKTRVPARCRACGVATEYYLSYVLSKTTGKFQEPVCRVCHWDSWADHIRKYRSELETTIFQLLAADPHSREVAAAAETHPEVLDIVRAVWWPNTRIAHTLALVHHDLLVDTADPNDGTHPVVGRCQQCGTLNVFLPMRMGAELSGRWCACQTCAQTKPRGTCVRDVQMGFERFGMRALEPQVGTDTFHDLVCARCGTHREATLRQLLRGSVPCYECDGAADPQSPHRVYLIHFQKWNAYKVGITGAYRDARIERHQQRGGVIVDLLDVPNRGTALLVESRVLHAVAAFPIGGEPLAQRVDGWTEMWDASAPVKVALDTFASALNEVEPPVAPVETRARLEPVALVGGASAPLERGVKICATGAAPGVSRGELKSWCEAAGITLVGSVGTTVAYLVVPDASVNSSKARRAVESGIPIITYETLFAHLAAVAPDARGAAQKFSF